MYWATQGMASELATGLPVAAGSVKIEQKNSNLSNGTARNIY